MLWSGQSEKFNLDEWFLVEGKAHSAIWNTMSRSVDGAFLPVFLLLYYAECLGQHGNSSFDCPWAADPIFVRNMLPFPSGLFWTLNQVALSSIKQTFLPLQWQEGQLRCFYILFKWGLAIMKILHKLSGTANTILICRTIWVVWIPVEWKDYVICCSSLDFAWWDQVLCLGCKHVCAQWDDVLFGV